jgi:hypothetical protein
VTATQQIPATIDVAVEKPISPISPLGLIKPFQKYKPQLKFLEIKKKSNKIA